MSVTLQPGAADADRLQQRNWQLNWQRRGLALALCAAALLPMFISDYQVYRANMLLVYAIAVFGVNILTGYNGQISIGHGAFYAIGAYTAAILIERFGWTYWLSIAPAAALCFFAGLAVGIPALRLAGHYLALATFALAMALPQLLRHDALAGWTGGVEGIALDKPPVPLSLPISQDAWLYYFSLGLLVVLFWLGRNVLMGRLGRVVKAVRDNPTAAAAMGINVSGCKIVVFAISAMYTGIAGALGAIVVQYVSPDSFNFFLSISFIVAVVVGGVGTVSGAVYGAAFILFMPNLAERISPAAPWAVYGACLILFLYVLPGGVASIASALTDRPLYPFANKRRDTR